MTGEAFWCRSETAGRKQSSPTDSGDRLQVTPADTDGVKRGRREQTGLDGDRWGQTGAHGERRGQTETDGVKRGQTEPPLQTTPSHRVAPPSIEPGGQGGGHQPGGSVES